jgi:hypothetical protein
MPSNQALLDWLAVDFMEQGWSMKNLCRTIVTSATYRQAPTVTQDRLEKDPYNRLLARGPRFRLEAEMVRDQALASAGLLSAKLHGPSVMPPQPEGIWQVVYSGDQWKESTGEDKYRREVCTVRRIRTNTPLQALVTLNDPAYIEAAQAMARRVLQEAPAPDLESRIRYAYLLAASRPPEAAEMESVKALYNDGVAQYSADGEIALAMATNPLGPPTGNTDNAELASWTLVSNVLLNLDEVLTKR